MENSQFSAQMSATGSSLLHLCAFKGNTDILKDLLEKNMNPFIANKQGDTCLHVAIRKRNYNFCMELVRWAVSKNITASQAEVENTTESLTPFMTAVLRDQLVMEQAERNRMLKRATQEADMLGDTIGIMFGGRRARAASSI